MATAIFLLVLIYYYSPFNKIVSAENIIFEQIGSLAGSTSYLHAHVTLSISSIEQQFRTYKRLLTVEYANVTRVLQMMNNLITPAMTNLTTNPKASFFSSTYVQGTAAIWSNIAKLHLEDMEDIKQHILSLRNLLPDIERANQNRVGHDPNFFQELVKRVTADSYIDEEPSRFTKSTLELDEMEIPFHFRETPLHEAAYLQYLKIKASGPTINQTSPGVIPVPLKPVPSSTSISNGRGKRMAGIVALPIAIAATAMGIYNSVQIQFLKNELLEVKDNVKRLFEVVQQFDKEISEINNAIREISSALLIMAVSEPSYFDARLTRIENQLRD